MSAVSGADGSGPEQSEHNRWQTVVPGTSLLHTTAGLAGPSWFILRDNFLCHKQEKVTMLCVIYVCLKTTIRYIVIDALDTICQNQNTVMTQTITQQ